MTDLATQLFTVQALEILGGLLALGYFLRLSVIPNQYIGWLVTAVSIGFSIGLLKLGWLEGTLRGLIFAGLSSLSYEQAVKWVQDWISSRVPRAPLIAALLIPTFILVGCGTDGVGTGGTTDPAATSTTSTLIADPTQNTKFVANVKIATGVLKAAGKLALASFTTGSDRTTYAQLLSGSGHVFESLENSGTPTSEQIQNAYSAYFPTSSADYVQIANVAATAISLGISYIPQFVPDSVKSSDPAIYVAYVNYVLKALAQTAYNVGDSVLGTTATAQ